MAQIFFYEKPGCINNTKQKKLLRAAGHEVIALDLLNTDWKADELLAFFQGLEVADWFNRTAPRVKSGEIDPDSIDADSAIEAMCADPLLIRRPLIRVGEGRMVGFATEELAQRLGIRIELEPQEDVESCPRNDEAHTAGCN